MQLLIKNGLILQNNGTFIKGHIGIDQGKIAALWYNDDPVLCDLKIDAGQYQFEAMMTIKNGRIVYRSNRFPTAVCGC